jgi:hypothetical protein
MLWKEEIGLYLIKENMTSCLKMIGILGLLAAASSVSALRQCTDTIHKVTSLPYWDKNVDFPCMYAGYYKVNATADQHHLFYWFFKNLSLPETAPVVLWMNGGPGSTSMFGLWLENGPLRVL